MSTDKMRESFEAWVTASAWENKHRGFWDVWQAALATVEPVQVSRDTCGSCVNFTGESCKTAFEGHERYSDSASCDEFEDVETVQVRMDQCTNSDSWNCKYCNKTATCKAINDTGNHGTPVEPEVSQPTYDMSIHSNPDAQAWAKFFMETIKFKSDLVIDESLMLGWFANAMMAMHDHIKQVEPEVSQPVAEGYLVNVGGSGEHLTVNWLGKPVEGLLYSSPPDYEALKVKIKNLEELAVDDQGTMEAQDSEIRRLELRVAEVSEQRDNIAALAIESYTERTRLESENEALKKTMRDIGDQNHDQYEQLAAYVATIESKCIEYRQLLGLEDQTK